jgi:CheY-like chemotaxis protein
VHSPGAKFRRTNGESRVILKGGFQVALIYFINPIAMKRKILLVDDDEDELFIFKEALKAAKLTADCTAVNSAENALIEIKRVKPDFIFTDINMGGMSGFELSKLIKNEPAFYDTPVIIYSNAVYRDTAAMAKLFGATTCIKKSAAIHYLNGP